MSYHHAVDYGHPEMLAGTEFSDTCIPNARAQYGRVEGKAKIPSMTEDFRQGEEKRERTRYKRANPNKSSGRTSDSGTHMWVAACQRRHKRLS